MEEQIQEACRQITKAHTNDEDIETESHMAVDPADRCTGQKIYTQVPIHTPIPDQSLQLIVLVYKRQRGYSS